MRNYITGRSQIRKEVTEEPASGKEKKENAQESKREVHDSKPRTHGERKPEDKLAKFILSEDYSRP